jgi:hypothetical protein
MRRLHCSLGLAALWGWTTVHVVFLLTYYQEELHHMDLATLNGSLVLEALAETYDHILYWDEDLWHAGVQVNLCAKVPVRPNASSRPSLWSLRLC